MRHFKVLACGGREFSNKMLVDTALRWIADVEQGAVFWLAHGNARGADTLAGSVARTLGWTVQVYQAEWARYGRAAGPMRNQRMLTDFKPDVVVAFPGNAGTADMIRRAQVASVPVWSLQGCKVC